MKQTFIVNLESLRNEEIDTLIKNGAKKSHFYKTECLLIDLEMNVKKFHISENTLFVGSQWIGSFNRVDYQGERIPFLTFALAGEPHDAFTQYFLTSYSPLTFFSVKQNREYERDSSHSPTKKMKYDEEPMDESTPYNSPRH